MFHVDALLSENRPELTGAALLFILFLLLLCKGFTFRFAVARTVPGLRRFKSQKEVNKTFTSKD